MSRPPRFRTAWTTTGSPAAGSSLDYLPEELADFVERQRELASEELGFPPSTAEGDFAGTLMELPALVAHILGVYQRRLASEAFLGTARSQRSLVRHGRRLGYEPGPGLSALGHVVFAVGEGLSGIIAAGLPLASSPVGEKKAQDYETLADVRVDAAWNAMWPAQATEPRPLAGATSLGVQGTELGLEPGDEVVLQVGSGPFGGSNVHVFAHRVVAMTEDEARGTTELEVEPALTASPPGGSFDGALLHARPRWRQHLFAWDASLVFGDLDQGAYPASDPLPGATATGYQTLPAGAYSDDDIYLDGEIDADVTDTPVVRLVDGVATAFKVGAQAVRGVVLKQVTHVVIDMPSPTPDLSMLPTVSVTRTVTAIGAENNGGAVLSRLSQVLRTSRWLLGWEVVVPLVTTRPNTAAVSQPLELQGAFDLAPGQLLLLRTRVGLTPAATEVVRLTSVGKTAGGDTTVGWELVEGSSSGPWQVGALELAGNVAAVSHGKTVTEVLGDSDGVTPFLRFALQQDRVTQLPGRRGMEAALAVRVAGVQFERVVDFEDSTPHDRHYLLQRDDLGRSWVLFGDGRKAAVPVSGRKHIEATYRVGTGSDGDAPPNALTRFKKPHPLLKTVHNPLPVRGGAEPADVEDVRSQATGFILTFDRAVSVTDHRNLALLFPGVARANAVWALLGGGVEGVQVVVADSTGLAPALTEVHDFLQARRDDTVPLAVVAAEAVDLVLEVGLAVDPAFRRELVELAVREALVDGSVDARGLFSFAQRDLGQPAFLSEVYERLQRIEGVTMSELTVFDLFGGTDRLDTVVAQSHQWLRLAPENLTLVPIVEVPS